MGFFGGSGTQKKASFADDAAPKRPSSADPRSRSGSTGGGKKPINRAVTVKKLSAGQDLNSLVGDINTGVKPNFQKLRKKHLDENTVIDDRSLKHEKVLGEGAFGVVTQCRFTPPRSHPAAALVAEAGGFVAVKKLKAKLPVDKDGVVKADEPSFIGDRELADFASELLMLKSLHHPNVIGYIGVTLQEDENGQDQIALVQEYAPYGTLKPLVNSTSNMRKPFTVGDGLRWTYHIAAGMAFLHDCKPPIIHRDLKPENILLCGEACTAKIADFGLVTFEKGGTRLANFKMTGKVGSMRYMAPENYRGDEYSRTNDQFSFAIIMYELLTRGRAYEGQFLSTEEIAKKVAADELRPTIPPQWPEEARKLIQSVWQDDHKKRPDFKEVAAELAKWRNDEEATVLRKIAKGAKRGFLEKINFEATQVEADYAAKHSKNPQDFKAAQGNMTKSGRFSSGRY